MQASKRTVLEPDEILKKLKQALADGGHVTDELHLVSQEPNLHASTFPSIILKCKTANGSEHNFLCKCSQNLIESHGHRGGVEYEVKIYRQVLSKSLLSSVKFFGHFTIASENQTWLILEFLDNCERISKTGDRENLVDAARWIGGFHAAGSVRLKAPELSFIRHYDADFFKGWAERTLLYSRRGGLNDDWIDVVCSKFDEAIEILLSAPATIIHGEYYPQNILYQDETVYPIDWESAAFSAGEIDLAALSEGWAVEDIERLTREYKYARWPGGATHNFNKTLLAAKIYLNFRWLGDRPEWTAQSPECFESLKSSAEEMGWL